jgi:hypothetical protein
MHRLPDAAMLVNCRAGGLFLHDTQHPDYASDDLLFVMQEIDARRFAEGLYGGARQFAPVMHKWIRPWVRAALGSDLSENNTLCAHPTLTMPLPWIRTFLSVLPSEAVERFGVRTPELLGYCGPGAGSKPDCDRQPGGGGPSSSTTTSIPTTISGSPGR